MSALGGRVPCWGRDQWLDRMRDGVADRQIVVYGDSWAHCPPPGSNLPTYLAPMRPADDIVVVGGNGMRLLAPLHRYTYEIEALAADLQGYAALVIVSGGGNDLIDWCRAEVISRQDDEVLASYDVLGAANRVGGRIGIELRRIAAMFRAPLLWHTYAYPDVRGGAFAPGIGPWIAPILDGLGLTNDDDRQNFAMSMVDAMVAGVTNAAGDARIVDLRDAAPSGHHDELHLQPWRMRLIANRFAPYFAEMLR